MIVLDATVLIALLEPTDAHHTRAVQLLSQVEGTMIVHSLTLAEVLVGPERLGIAGQVDVDLRGIGVQESDLGAGQAMLLARTRAEYRLKMPDTCVLATAIHHGCPLASFDDRLRDAAYRAGLLDPR